MKSTQIHHHLSRFKQLYVLAQLTFMLLQLKKLEKHQFFKADFKCLTKIRQKLNYLTLRRPIRKVTPKRPIGRIRPFR